MSSHDKEYIQNLRHSAAHLLAAAVLELYPDAKIAIGPATHDGFYYDIAFKQAPSEKDLKKIQRKMKKMSNKWDTFERMEVTADEARKHFPDNPYKQELIDELEKNSEQITLYKSGDFIDLCRGGHVENPNKELTHFKLLSLAGAYWRGDENNDMLTRIYGTAFPSKEELDQHLQMLEEAKKRDHKKLGRELGLFTFSSLVGSGLPLWTPKGTIIRNLLDEYVWKLRKERGYQKVAIPHLTKKALYETSGHWDKFDDELFTIKTREGHEFAMKPMNCPHHTQIFASEQHSYKDMPQRYTETTMVYRDEQTGELAGLSRVRSITQDDAHVFCRESQIEEEVSSVWDIVNEFYEPFGFNLDVSLSLRDPENPDNYIGTDTQWQSAEDALRNILDKRGAEYRDAPGEAAFYGPKIDFISRDALGREWQVATIQLDINMPDRFDLTCINENGEKERIYMIHAAIMGSIERFVSVLIEHFAGNFPLWLSPTQVAVLPITDDHNKLAEKITAKLREHDIRTELDDESKTLPSKIRKHTLQKVPYMCIIGDKEAQKSLPKDQPGSDEADLFVSVRTREGNDIGMMSLQALIDQLTTEIEQKTLQS